MLRVVTTLADADVIDSPDGARVPRLLCVCVESVWRVLRIVWRVRLSRRGRG